MVGLPVQRPMAHHRDEAPTGRIDRSEVPQPQVALRQAGEPIQRAQLQVERVLVDVLLEGARVRVAGDRVEPVDRHHLPGPTRLVQQQFGLQLGVGVGVHRLLPEVVVELGEDLVAPRHQPHDATGRHVVDVLGDPRGGELQDVAHRAHVGSDEVVPTTDVVDLARRVEHTIDLSGQPFVLLLGQTELRLGCVAHYEVNAGLVPLEVLV